LVNRSANRATRTRLNVVPSIAATLFGPSPCASEIVSSITAIEPTSATPSGEVPSRIAGTMKRVTTSRLAANPSSESAPRSRPKAITRAQKSSASQSIGDRRSKSVRLYCGAALGSAPEPEVVPGGRMAFETRITSPASRSGSSGPEPTGRVTVTPSSAPVSIRARAVTQVPGWGGGQGAEITSVTSARWVGAVRP
jgi:hypothetical protein